jgi:hypothetical protein
VSETISFETLRRLTEGRDTTTAHLISLTVQEINSAEERIITLIRAIEDKTARIKDNLAKGLRLGSAEQIDRSGPDLDQAMTARQIHWQNLAILVGQETAAGLARRDS